MRSIIFACIGVLLFLQSCNNDIKKQGQSLSTSVKEQIAEGNRLVNVNNDSLKIVTQKLYYINRTSPNDTALAYADFFEGTFYWRNADHEKAMQLAIQSLERAQKAGVNDALPQIYLLITNIENEINDYSLAYATLQKGLSSAISGKDTASIIALKGLKGMLLRNEGATKNRIDLIDKSLEITDSTLLLAKTNIKFEWLQIRLLNSTGQCYLYKKDYERSIPYFEQAISLGTKYNQELSLIRSYCRLGEALYYSGNIKDGLPFLHKSLALARVQGVPYWLLETTAAFYRCYSSSNNYKMAMRFNIENGNISDSLKALTDVRRIGELQLKYEKAKKDKEIQLLSAQNKLETLLLYASLLIVLLLIVIATLYYLKQQREKELLLKEKALLDDELRTAEIELNIFTENLKDKNNLIEEFKSEIEHLQSYSVNKADIEHMEQLLHAHIMTEENWNRFKKLFDKVHPGFFNKLKNKIIDTGNLTTTDVRMLVLIKLQLSNQEMANLAGITIEGIKKSKQRLRKKLGIDAKESLTHFVATL